MGESQKVSQLWAGEGEVTWKPRLCRYQEESMMEASLTVPRGG
jgi:hypothetical protein